MGDVGTRFCWDCRDTDGEKSKLCVICCNNNVLKGLVRLTIWLELGKDPILA